MHINLSREKDCCLGTILYKETLLAIKNILICHSPVYFILSCITKHCFFVKAKVVKLVRSLAYRKVINPGVCGQPGVYGQFLSVKIVCALISRAIVYRTPRRSLCYPSRYWLTRLRDQHQSPRIFRVVRLSWKELQCIKGRAPHFYWGEGHREHSCFACHPKHSIYRLFRLYSHFLLQ